MRVLLPLLLLPACLEPREGRMSDPRDTSPDALAEVTDEVAPEVAIDVPEPDVAEPDIATVCPTVRIDEVTQRERDDSLGFEVVVELEASSSRPVAGYHWALTQQPFGGQDAVGGALVHDGRLVFTATNPGTYEFTLDAITPDRVRACEPTVRVVEVPPPSRGLFVELLWSVPTTGPWLTADVAPGPQHDLDLHFLHPNADGAFDGGWDAFWYNEGPEWGVLGETRDNPFFTEASGTPGRETVYLREYDPGARYCSLVHHAGGPDGANFHIRFYGDGTKFSEQVQLGLTERDLFESLCFTWRGDLDSLTTDYRDVTTPDVNPFGFPDP